jgi:hypothetical protein
LEDVGILFAPKKLKNHEFNFGGKLWIIFLNAY